jgi:ligand-binding SRPBCC domain-containing protein
MSQTIQRTSRLPVSAERAWRHATSMPAINREIAPWLRMTYPAALAGLTLDDPRVMLGEPLFTSWVLAGGLVPVERMALTLTELDRGHRFVEESRMTGMRSWRHARTIAAVEGGCELRDEVTFAAPIARLEPTFARVLAAFFAHRHRRLAQLLVAERRV